MILYNSVLSQWAIVWNLIRPKNFAICYHNRGKCDSHIHIIYWIDGNRTTIFFLPNLCADAWFVSELCGHVLNIFVDINKWICRRVKKFRFSSIRTVDFSVLKNLSVVNQVGWFGILWFEDFWILMIELKQLYKERSQENKMKKKTVIDLIQIVTIVTKQKVALSTCAHNIEW